MRFVSSPRLGYLGQQVLPADFDKMSPEEKVKFIDSLPPDLKQKALLEVYLKLPPDRQREWIEIWKNVSDYEKDTTRLLIATIGSFAFDTLVLMPAENASPAARTGAYLGSGVLSGLAAYHSYRILTNPVSGNFAKVASAFVGVFTSVDLLIRVISLLKKEKVTDSPVISPKTSLAVAVSGKR